MRRAPSTLACVLALSLLAAACGGDGHAPSTSAPATTATTAAEPDSTAPGGVDAFAAATHVAPTPQVTTPLAEVQEAVLEIGSPDYLAELDGAVWTKLDGGDVVALDPATARRVRAMDVDLDQDDLCQGLGAGDGHLFSCSGADLVRIDAATGDVVDTIPDAKLRDQGPMPFAAGRVWVLGPDGETLVGVDAATGEPGEPLTLPVPCGDVGPGAGGTLWVVCGLQDVVLQVDAAKGEVLARLELEAPAVAYGTETDVWVGYAGGLARIDLATLQPVVVFEGLNPDLTGDLAVAGDDVWVRQAQRFLTRVDAATDTVAMQVEPPEALSGGSVLLTDDAVWVTAYDDNRVFRLRRDA